LSDSSIGQDYVKCVNYLEVAPICVIYLIRSIMLKIVARFRCKHELFNKNI